MIGEYWKFNAVDCLSASDIPESELTSILGTLIESEILKQFLSR